MEDFLQNLRKDGYHVLHFAKEHVDFDVARLRSKKVAIVIDGCQTQLCDTISEIIKRNTEVRIFTIEELV
jgi:hypothetical protein